MLRKGVYPYEYRDSWERFNEVYLPNKNAFYSELILAMKIISMLKKYSKNLNKENLSGYHDLCLKSNVLLLADVLENFRKMCLETCELDPAKFISAPGLARQAALEKIQVKLHLLTDIDMLLIVEKSIRGGICNAVHRYAKANNKYMED